jgi:transcriptional regulator with XRE-family HTH domain
MENTKKKENIKLSLKAARVNVGLTQSQAAKRIGVNADTIRSWEKGKTFPGAHMIEKIERTYNITYDHLIFLPANNAFSVKTETNQQA